MVEVTQPVVCPTCGDEFDWTFNVPIRAKTGSGTQKPIAKLTRNFIQLCDVILHNPFKTVQEVRDILKARGLLYQMKDREKWWDRHECQAALSLLVGNGFMTMSGPFQETFDYIQGKFVVSPTPRYYMTQGNAKKYARWMKAQHNVTVQLPPPLDNYISDSESNFVFPNVTTVITAMSKEPMR